MICINCFHKKTSVVNSRPHKKTAQIWRRRSCPECQHVFTSYERPALHEELTIIDSSDTKSAYNPGRLFVDLLHCFEPHTQKHYDDAFWLARSIEDALVGVQSPLSTETLKEVIYTTLSRFDSLAGIQYAARHRLDDKLRRGRPKKRR